MPDSAWSTRAGAACSFNVTSGPLTGFWHVPPLEGHATLDDVNSADGNIWSLSVSLCGPSVSACGDTAGVAIASLEAAGSAPAAKAKAGIVTNAGSVLPAVCQVFGEPSGSTRISLLHPGQPQHGIQMAYEYGPYCNGGRPQGGGDGGKAERAAKEVDGAKAVIQLHCDPTKKVPILKGLSIKGGCELQASFTAAVGCPERLEQSVVEAGECSGSCTPELLTNGVCDAQCNHMDCMLDNGDCDHIRLGCPGCQAEWLKDGVCDDACFTEACHWDEGDCLGTDGTFVQPLLPRCDPACPATWQGDGECDPACNLQVCGNDGGDCATQACVFAVATGAAWDTDGLSWYDLNAFAVQTLVVETSGLLLGSPPTLLQGSAHLSLSVCDAMVPSLPAVNVPSCSTRASDPWEAWQLHGSSALIAAETFADGAITDVAGVGCLLESLGERNRVRAALLDEAAPSRGISLTFSNGSVCDEGGKSERRVSTTYQLLCAAEPAGTPPRLMHWRYSECSWLFTFRFVGACPLPRRPAPQECPPVCIPSWLGDGQCDRPCNVSACEFDGGDCPARDGWCELKCQPSWLADGVCDDVCATAACEYDGGDCSDNKATSWRCWLGVETLLGNGGSCSSSASISNSSRTFRGRSRGRHYIEASLVKRLDHALVEYSTGEVAAVASSAAFLLCCCMICVLACMQRRVRALRQANLRYAVALAERQALVTPNESNEEEEKRDEALAV